MSSDLPEPTFRCSCDSLGRDGRSAGMDTDAAPQPGDNPATVYSKRLGELLHLQAAEQKQEKRLGYAKVALALLTLVSAVIFLRNATVLEILLTPVAIFVFLAVLHERRLESIRLRQRTIHFYGRGIARLEDRWAGTGETGNAFSSQTILMRAIWICLAEGRCSNCFVRREHDLAKRRWPRGCCLLLQWLRLLRDRLL